VFEYLIRLMRHYARSRSTAPTKPDVSLRFTCMAVPSFPYEVISPVDRVPDGLLFVNMVFVGKADLFSDYAMFNPYY
jgi:hypothetical protein